MTETDRALRLDEDPAQRIVLTAFIVVTFVAGQIHEIADCLERASSNPYRAKLLKTLATDIVIGKFGVREPAANCAEIPLNRFDLLLVPGMAFDLYGHRLGRGQGFYDRILAEASGIKCGVAYDFQLLELIPTEAHDAKVDFIFTPSRGVRRKN